MAVADAQAFFVHAEHQPLALTNLPPSMLQGPSATPSFPEYKHQGPVRLLLQSLIEVLPFILVRFCPSGPAHERSKRFGVPALDPKLR